MITSFATIVAGLTIVALAHTDHENQKPMSGPHKGLWYNTLPGDGGTQVCSFFLRESGFFFIFYFLFFFEFIFCSVTMERELCNLWGCKG